MNGGLGLVQTFTIATSPCLLLTQLNCILFYFGLNKIVTTDFKQFRAATAIHNSASRPTEIHFSLKSNNPMPVVPVVFFTFVGTLTGLPGQQFV